MHPGYEFSQSARALPFLAIMLFIIIVLAVAALTLLAWCMIFKRAGYSWALGLLTVVPVANVIVFLVLAFSKWPVQRELEELRTVAVHRQYWPQPSQGRAAERPPVQ